VSALASIWAALGWKGAAIASAFLVGFGSLWAFIRRRKPGWASGVQARPPAPGANSPEHGKIDKARQAEEQRISNHIREEAARVRRKLGGGGAVLLAIGLVSLAGGCAHAPSPVPASAGPIPRAYLTLEKECEAKDGAVVCSQAGILQAIDEDAEAVIAAERCRIGLGAEQAHRAVDQAACSEVALERDQAMYSRWIWGSVGVAIGALAAGLMVGLIQ